MSNFAICIGRHYGSGGREIGEKLARELGIPCYDKLLVKKAAQESGMSEEYIEKHDESPINSIQFLSGNPYADTVAIANTFYKDSEIAYNAEHSTIEKLATQGPCVIIGRCASAIIPKENRLSVFIYADKEDRIQRVMQRNALSEKEADVRIRKMDRLRKQYFNYYAESEWGQPESYDMMLSSSNFSIDQCVWLIKDAVMKREGLTNE